jgi:hypothetical protein
MRRFGFDNLRAMDRSVRILEIDATFVGGESRKSK